MLPCLPWLTAFKKGVLYPSTGVSSICYQHGITPAASCQGADTHFITHTPHLHAEPLTISCPGSTGMCLSVGPKPPRQMGSGCSTCRQQGCEFVNQEQDSHAGVIVQLSGMDSLFESPWVEHALICVSLTLFAVIQCCD